MAEKKFPEVANAKFDARKAAAKFDQNPSVETANAAKAALDAWLELQEEGVAAMTEQELAEIAEECRENLRDACLDASTGH